MMGPKLQQVTRQFKYCHIKMIMNKSLCCLPVCCYCLLGPFVAYRYDMYVKTIKEEALENAIISVGKELKQRGYHFTTITPNSHTRNLAKLQPLKNANQSGSEVLRYIFGWNAPVKESELNSFLGDSIVNPLSTSSLIRKKHNEAKSAIRFSTFRSPHRLYLFSHSSFPTTESDAIFFGPDTYRFFRFLSHTLPLLSPSSTNTRVIDVGAGSGAGGIFVGGELQRQRKDRQETGGIEVVLSDINARALSFSRANVALNFGEEGNSPKFQFVESNLFNSVDGNFDLIISNPPYMVDTESKSIQEREGNSRIYRDGGGDLGIDLALKIVEKGMERLNVNGIIALYTGVPILVGGQDPFHEQLVKTLSPNFALLSYEEIDVDVWGEELETKAYAFAERIGVFGIVVQRKQ